jgi:hypothetical protein
MQLKQPPFVPDTFNFPQSILQIGASLDDRFHLLAQALLDDFYLSRATNHGL